MPSVHRRLSDVCFFCSYLTYIERVLPMRCFVDMMQLGVFPTAKDVSESMGALQAASQFAFSEQHADASARQFNPRGEFVVKTWRDPGTLVLAIGDGTTPRTAALVSFMTQWTAISIDPELQDKWCGANPQEVERLHGVRGTFEQWMDDLRTGAAALPSGVLGHVHTLVLLCVHSHNQFRGAASLDRIRERFPVGRICLVSLPCCQRFNPRHDLGRAPDVSYEDMSIFSAHRKVNIWLFSAPKS